MPYGYPGTTNYGSAPYEESTKRKLLRALAGGLIGLGGATPGASFGQALGQGFGRSYLAARTERDAAMEYAMKMEDQKRRQEQDALHNKYMEAQIENMNRPAPPEKPTKDQEAERILGRTLTDDERKMLAGVYREPKDQPKKEGPKLGDLNTLSDNFRTDKDVQNFTVVRDNVRRIEANAKLGTGPGDLAVIFAYMRVLDPESVVRETEFKNAAEAMGRLQMMANIPKRWVSGNRLTPEGRLGFLQSARTLYDAQRRTYERKAKMFERQAKQYNVDPTLVVPNYSDEDTEFIFDSSGNLIPK